MNGDSYINADLEAYYSWFLAINADAAMMLARVADTARFGNVIFREDGLILGFEEKDGNSGHGWINAGVYLFKRQVLLSLPLLAPSSLELDLFPLLAGKSLYAYSVAGDFIDIGTPESYLEANRLFQRFNQSPAESQ
jgi:NDP-sugar pyrophosphorylase family protein